MDKDKFIKKLKTLKQFKDLPEEDLEKIAQRKMEEKELKDSFVGLMDEEVERALSLYYKYLDENSFESLAEKSTLITLVSLEIMRNRLLNAIKKFSTEKQGAVDFNGMEEVRELNSQISETKKSLKMMNNQEGDSIAKRWADLEASCLTYYEQHAAEFQERCPYCSKIFPIILPPEKLEAKKSSWFRGTDLYNKKIFELFHNKKITQEEAAEILDVSKFYIELMYNEIYLKELNDYRPNN
jgi:hypothetical protein